MHIFAVGQLFIPTVTRWTEMPQYNFRSGQHELTLFVNSPTDEEIASVESGQCQFAFAVESGVIFFLYRFEPAVPWGDAPFTIHLMSEAERELPEPLPPDELHVLLHTFLVDAATGILKAMRVLTFSADFTRKFHKAITDQAAQPFSADGHAQIVQNVYRRWRPKDLLRRAIAQTRGAA